MAIAPATRFPLVALSAWAEMVNTTMGGIEAEYMGRKSTLTNFQLPPVNKRIERYRHVAERYSGASGVILKQCILRAGYDTDRHVAWFTAEGRRALCRHPGNQKAVDADSDDMSERVKREGALDEFRSKALRA